jgi:hypothetical protein
MKLTPRSIVKSKQVTGHSTALCPLDLSPSLDSNIAASYQTVREWFWQLKRKERAIIFRWQMNVKLTVLVASLFVFMYIQNNVMFIQFQIFLICTSYNKKEMKIYQGTVFWDVTRCCSSEMLLPIYQTIRCHVSEGRNLHSHCIENLKSHIK